MENPAAVTETKILEAQASGNDENSKIGWSYPYKSFDDTYAFVSKIYDELGHDVYHTRDQIAALFNMAANSIKQPISSAQQFGMLEIKHGTGYKTTDLFGRLYLPGDDDEKAKSILDSLKSSKLYSDLFNLYEKSGILPNITGLTNTITRNYKFEPSLSGKIAREFAEALKHHGFLDDKNILRLSFKTQPVPDVTQKSEPTDKPENETGTVTVIIPLREGKKAKLTLPDHYTDKDLKRIKKFVNALMDDEQTDESDS